MRARAIAASAGIRSEMASPIRRLVGPIVLLSSTIFLAMCLHATSGRVHLNPTSAVDLLPLWLGGHALAAGHDPNDPAVLEAVYRAKFPPVRATSFYSYYPPTAALLARPLSALPFPTAARVWAALSALSFVVTAAACVATAPTRGRVWAFVAFEVLLGLFMLTRTERGAIGSGQPGPEVLVATAIAIAALGRGHDRLGGTVLAVGAGLKLFPLVLVPSLLRRPRALVAVFATSALLTLGVVLHQPAIDLGRWLADLAHFVDQPVSREWQRRDPMWLLRLWQGRFLALGIPTLLLTLWAARRAPSAQLTAATAALLAAWGGTIMAGSSQYHEALVLLPAVGWVLAWPAQRGPLALSAVTAAGLLAALVNVGVLSPFATPGSLHWVTVGYTTWIGCVIRWVWALRASNAPPWLAVDPRSPGGGTPPPGPALG